MPKPVRLPISRLIETAHDLANVSGRAILKHFRRTIAIDNKAAVGAFDPVTEADRAGERAIRKRLAEIHPKHAIVGEEFGHQGGEQPYTWMIDPVDGTRAFITGMPLWGTLIGVTYAGRAEVGMMDQPYTRERVWSGSSATYWRAVDGRTRRIRTSPCARLADARLTTTSPDLFVEAHERDAFARLKGGARLTRYGGDCYGYCLLAAGHIDMIVESGLKPYDVVALIPIIERAGGIITTWDGGRAENGGRILACGDPRLHAVAVKLLQGK